MINFLRVGVLLSVSGLVLQTTALKPKKIGVLPVPEVSGAAVLPGIGRDSLVVASDEGGVLTLFENGFECITTMDFSNPRQIGGTALSTEIDDIEDLAWDPTSKFLYIITSHSKNKSDEVKKKRYFFSRLSIDGSGTVTASHATERLNSRVMATPVLKVAADRKHGLGGTEGSLNIEGLALNGRGGLIIGFRGPQSDNSQAVYAVIDSPEDLFSPGSSSGALTLQSLDLGGQGIRGMYYDAKAGGIWILSGASEDPDLPVSVPAWNLFFWNMTGAPVPVTTKSFTAFRGETVLWAPESLCIFEAAGKRYMSLFGDAGDVNGKFGPSPYVYFDMSDLMASL